jgi:hypothetical protein
MVGIEKIADKGKKPIDKLAFIDGDAFDSFANLLFRGGDGLQNFPGVAGVEFQGIHFAVAEGIAALDDAWAAFGVVAGLEDENILAGVLAAHLGAAQ